MRTELPSNFTSESAKTVTLDPDSLMCATESDESAKDLPKRLPEMDEERVLH